MKNHMAISADMMEMPSDALEKAKKLPPGAKRIEAIKKAGRLRVAADMKDLLIAKARTE
jgi:hypothetical protein